MRSKLLSGDDGVRIFVVVLDSGDEAFRAISDFAAQQNVTAAAVTAIGAFETAVVGWFDFASKDLPQDSGCRAVRGVECDGRHRGGR